MAVTNLRLINMVLFAVALVLAASPYAAFCMLPAGAMGYVTRLIDEAGRSALKQEGE